MTTKSTKFPDLFLKQIESQSGFTLIEVLTMSVVMMIMLMGMTTMMNNQARETRALAEKMGSLDLSRTLTTVLTSDACSLLITKAGNVQSGALTFQTAATSFPTLNLKAIPASNTTDAISTSNPIVSPLSNSLKLTANNSIQLQVASATTANVLVHFDQTKLIRSIKDISVPVTLTTTTSGANTTITGCTSSGDGGRTPSSTPTDAGSPCQAQAYKSTKTYAGITIYGVHGRCCLMGSGSYGKVQGGGTDSYDGYYAYCMPF